VKGPDRSMTTTHQRPRAARLALLAALTLVTPALAQDSGEPMERDALGRRVTTGMTTTLAFKNVTVERLIPFIVESTGKVVVPRQEVLSRRITILNDEPIPQSEALDLVFLALQQEGIAAGRFTHPGAIQIFDFDREGDRTLYLAMEFLDGEDLKRYLKRKGRLTPAEAVAIARQILSVLSEAHALNIIHRDLKPDNVMVLRSSGDEPLVKVLDFGLSKLVDVPLGASLQTQVGRILGTPLYMAPEQVAGEDVDHRADLYATGLILYELLAGLTPFPDQSTTEVLFSRATREAPSINESFPDLGLPPALDAVLAKAMQRRRGDRYQSAGAMLADLEAVAAPGRSRSAAVSRSAARTAPLLSAAGRRAKHGAAVARHRPLVVGALAVLLVAVGLFALLGPLSGRGGDDAASRLRARDPASLGATETRYLGLLDTARTARERGDRDAALLNASDAVALGLEDAEAPLLRARLRLELGRLAEARADVDAARQLVGADPEVELLAGWIALEAGDVAVAAEAFAHAAERAGEDDSSARAAALAGASAAALEEGDLTLARERAEQAIAVDDGVAVAHRSLGAVELAAGDSRAALEHMTRARSRDRQDWRSALGLATAYGARDELLEAERPLLDARAANPNVLEVRRRLAANYVQRELWPEARDELRDALDRFPDDGELLVLRGLLLEADGDTEGALAAIDAGLENGVRDAAAHALLGVLYHERGDARAARDHYESARSRDDTLALPWLNLGLLALEDGGCREAIELFEGALERDDELLLARFSLGVAQRDYLGDADAARQTFQRYVDAGGRDPRVQQWLDELGG